MIGSVIASLEARRQQVIFKELLFLGGMWEYSERASIKQRQHNQSLYVIF